jgi:LPXTG-motif cell wall-anchored protein
MSIRAKLAGIGALALLLGAGGVAALAGTAAADPAPATDAPTPAAAATDWSTFPNNGKNAAVNDWFTRLDSALLADPQTYAGWEGAPEGAAVYLAAGHQVTAPVQALIDEGRSLGLQVDVVGVARSRADLQAIVDGFPQTQLYRQLGSNFWYIQIDGTATDKVAIGLFNPTPADIALIKAAYGDAVNVVGDVLPTNSATASPRPTNPGGVLAQTGARTNPTLIGLAIALLLAGSALLAIARTRRRAH